MKRPWNSSRQKELLRILLFSSEPISLQRLAGAVKVSVRTVQRELGFLESQLQDYGLELVKKLGAGICIEGASVDLMRFQKDLKGSEIPVTFSPEERQQGLIRDLILSKEPFKLYTFSRKYGVTEATISYDMDRVEQWFREFGVSLVRKPGLGAFLEGTEQQLRLAASKLLHKVITVEEWLEVFHMFAQYHLLHAISLEELQDALQNRLLGFVHIPQILSVQKSILAVMESQADIQLTDRDFVNLVIHLTLSVERVKYGEFIEKGKTALAQIEHTREFQLASQIVKLLEDELQIVIPPLEIGYVAMHLQGACLTPYAVMQTDQDHDLFQWLDLAKSFIRSAELHLGERLSADEILLEGLITHLVPAVNRLKLSLQIHNPMLDDIKSNYPEVYRSCREAANHLSNKLGYSIPDEEVGYLAMHVGASLIRNKEKHRSRYAVILVCASGMGTSHFLASRLKKEFSNIDIKAIVSAFGLKEWLKANPVIDLIISTVPLPPEFGEKAVNVTPFLNEKDQEFVRLMMEANAGKPYQEMEHSSTAFILSEPRYDEAISQILRHFSLIEGLKPKGEGSLIAYLVEKITPTFALSDKQQLIRDLEEREKIGSFILGDLAMIHTKSSGVKELVVTVFRMEQSVEWTTPHGEYLQPVRTVLLMAAPLATPKEHLEMVSTISAELIENSFLECLSASPFPTLKQTLQDRLFIAFKEKTLQATREP